MTEEHDLIKVEQTVKEIGVTEQMIRELIDEGKLRIVPVGNIERISLADR